MQWSLFLTRAMFVAILCLSAASTAVAQGTQIQGPRDAADVYSGVVYGPIDPSDTLWAISGQYRKNQQFTVYQVMLAIYELNPRAFVNRNFNTMVNGSVLKLPTDRYIARIDPARARAKAEQDDQEFTQSTGRRGTSTNQATDTPPDLENLKPDVPLVNKEQLDAAQKQFQQQINSLKRQQASIVNDFKQQLEQSIQATQTIVDENKVVLDELARKDEEIVALRTELSEDFQAKLDDQAAQIEELREFVALTKMKEEAREDSSFGKFISEPIFIIIAATAAFFIIFVLLALRILRKPTSDREKNQSATEDITVDDPVSHDADALLALLESDDISEDDLLDDILSDELEESLDELAIDIDDFGDIDDEILLPDEKGKKSKNELSDAAADLKNADISLDEDLLDLDTDTIDLDKQNVVLEGDDDFDLDDLGETEADLEEVDIDSILDEQSVDITPVKADDDSLTESFVEIEVASELDDEQLEIDIDDLLEQNVPTGDLPEGISLNASGEIDDTVIEQIQSKISENNNKINALTKSFEEELANDRFVDDDLVDDNVDDESDLMDPQSNIVSDQQKAIRPLDELTKGLEDDIADAIANPEDEDISDYSEYQEVDDPLTDELLNELSVEQPEKEIDAAIEELLTQPVEEEITSKLEDSLNELQTGTIDFEQHEEIIDGLEDSLLDENGMLKNDIVETIDDNAKSEDTVEEAEDSALDILVADGNENEDLEVDDDLLKALDSTDPIGQIELDDSELDNLDLEGIAEFDNENSALHEELARPETDESMLALDDIPSFANDVLEPSPTNIATKAAEEGGETSYDEKNGRSNKTAATSDDDLLDLPGLDEWLDDDEDVDADANQKQNANTHNDDSDLAQALDNYTETDSEDDVLRQIEEADFDSLLEEMGALSDEQTAAEIDKLAIDDLDNTEVEGSLDDAAPENLDNPDLDLTALFDESPVEDSNDFIDVDSLLQESENVTPATDEELALDLDMSLDKFLHEDAKIDVDLDAGQASNLDLAQVYIDMEDGEAAAEALEEVLKKGNDKQKIEARALLKQLKG